MSGSDDRVGASEGVGVKKPAFSEKPGFFTAARVCVGVVLAWNVQCALAFLLEPGTYAAGFELSGSAGSAAVRGIGLLFLMWNVPYAVALWQPVKRRVSLYEALAMQAIGLVGESLILLSLPAASAVARGSLMRFVAFDGAGLVLLVVALATVRREKG